VIISFAGIAACPFSLEKCPAKALKLTGGAIGLKPKLPVKLSCVAGPEIPLVVA
jgi:hypothetical protein